MPCLINFTASNMAAKMTNKIKVYRAMNELTQEDLAKAVGVTRQTILAIENNKYMPSLELALKIARIFERPVEEIFIYER
jgi:putative transcriptional regulator